ncbi:MAG TPA: mannose-1-phosphate guanylyltransferase [Planctomycetota bacterium]|nr:mannose-1-phosphate guanylyltransferase [Planctomycetota bacterium]
MIHGVVMAGGSGTRFWPLSRKLRPKQLLPVTGRAPMVAETVARLGKDIPPERVWVVTHRDQAEAVRRALPALPRENVIEEPQARNTCACAGLAAAVVAARDPDAILVTMPADHDIAPAASFQRTIRAACESVARHDGFVIFGIRPTHPATGYGYIRRGEALHTIDGTDVYRVTAFREKPDASTAAHFLEAGDHLWNSGIFVWRASTLRRAIAEHEPAIGSALAAIDAGLATPKRAEVIAAAYAGIRSVSVDIGVLERATDVRVIEIDYRWSDVGSWDALDDLIPEGADRHRVVMPQGGSVVSVGSSGCLVYGSSPHAIALVGVDDLIVVHTPDGTLVCRRGRAEDVKKVVDRLAAEGKSDLL